MHSKEIQHRAAIHYLHFDRSLRRVANIYGVSKSSVCRWANTIESSTAKHTRRTKQTAVERVTPIIAEKLTENPFMTIDALMNALRESGERIGKTTIHNAIHCANFTRKRTRPRFAPKTASPEDARSYLREVCCTPEVISVDETSIYVDDSPRYGYTLKGKRCIHRRKCPSRTGRVTLLLAVSPVRGVIHHAVVKGSMTSDRFASFIMDLNAPDCIVLLDNACFHKTATVREAAHVSSLRLVFTPPYSPEFNPIEGYFSVLKQALRTRRLEDIKAALQTITARKVAAFFQHSIGHAENIARHGG